MNHNFYHKFYHKFYPKLVLSGYPRVDVGLYGGSGVKVGLLLEFYHVNRSLSDHYQGEVGTIGTRSGRAGGPIWPSKGGRGPVRWFWGQSLPNRRVLPCKSIVKWPLSGRSWHYRYPIWTCRGPYLAREGWIWACTVDLGSKLAGCSSFLEFYHVKWTLSKGGHGRKINL